MRHPSTSEGEVAAGGDVPGLRRPDRGRAGTAWMWLRASLEVAAQYERSPARRGSGQSLPESRAVSSLLVKGGAPYGNAFESLTGSQAALGDGCWVSSPRPWGLTVAAVAWHPRDLCGVVWLAVTVTRSELGTGDQLIRVISAYLGICGVAVLWSGRCHRSAADCRLRHLPDNRCGSGPPPGLASARLWLWPRRPSSFRCAEIDRARRPAAQRRSRTLDTPGYARRPGSDPDPRSRTGAGKVPVHQASVPRGQQLACPG